MPINILMPALSPTMEEGTLAKWLVKEGDKVTSGEVMAEIETDKATMEVEAVDEGVLGKILVPEGTEGVKVNDVIAILLEEGETAADLGAGAPAEGGRTGGGARAGRSACGEAGGGAAPRRLPRRRRRAGRVFASPLARRIAKEKGLDLGAVKGSGPHGRIVKADVEAAKAGAPPAASPAAATAAAPPAPAAAAAPRRPGRTPRR